MRASFTLVAVAAAAALSACASTDGPSRYQTELDALEADCRARGGILQPTGATTGQPALEYACRITGPGSRIP